eukprot:TRINITY_DN26547_c0_g1_i1.p1 TRINITY_DN26547_c0_g1~~TRINITY_DN26547_c0_g1_i1.p1  ORF type:complete len:999 (+),score=195.74 TRINITY_DN26547_c0_g1_i1:237-3233(+)
MSCEFCGRGFAADRVYKHMAICGKLKQARPKAPDGTVLQAPEKIFDATGYLATTRTSSKEDSPTPPPPPPPAAPVRAPAAPKQRARTPSVSSARSPPKAATGSARSSSARPAPASAKRRPAVDRRARPKEAALGKTSEKAPAVEGGGAEMERSFSDFWATSTPTPQGLSGSTRASSTRASAPELQFTPSNDVVGSDVVTTPSVKEEGTWRQRHQELLSAIRNARGEKQRTRSQLTPSVGNTPTGTGEESDALETSTASALSHPPLTPPHDLSDRAKDSPRSRPLQQRAALRQPKVVTSARQQPGPPPAAAAETAAPEPPAGVVEHTRSDPLQGAGGVTASAPSQASEPRREQVVQRRSSAPLLKQLADLMHPSTYPAAPLTDRSARAAEQSLEPWKPGDDVMVQGLSGAAHLNGQRGSLLAYDTDAGCWLARLHSGDVKALRPEHMGRLLGSESNGGPGHHQPASSRPDSQRVPPLPPPSEEPKERVVAQPAFDVDVPRAEVVAAPSPPSASTSQDCSRASSKACTADFFRSQQAQAVAAVASGASKWSPGRGGGARSQSASRAAREGAIGGSPVRRQQSRGLGSAQRQPLSGARRMQSTPGLKRIDDIEGTPGAASSTSTLARKASSRGAAALQAMPKVDVSTMENHHRPSALEAVTEKLSETASFDPGNVTQTTYARVPRRLAGPGLDSCETTYARLAIKASGIIAADISELHPPSSAADDNVAVASTLRGSGGIDSTATPPHRPPGRHAEQGLAASAPLRSALTATPAAQSSSQGGSSPSVAAAPRSLMPQPLTSLRAQQALTASASATPMTAWVTPAAAAAAGPSSPSSAVATGVDARDAARQAIGGVGNGTAATTAPSTPAPRAAVDNKQLASGGQVKSSLNNPLMAPHPPATLRLFSSTGHGGTTQALVPSTSPAAGESSSLPLPPQGTPTVVRRAVAPSASAAALHVQMQAPPGRSLQVHYPPPGAATGPPQMIRAVHLGHQPIMATPKPL